MSLRQHSGEVRSDAATGHVAERVHAVADVGDEPQERRGVEAGGLEQGFAPRRAQLGALSPYWMPPRVTMCRTSE
jgi:hypothetical protein